MKKNQKPKNKIRYILWTTFFIIFFIFATSIWYIWNLINEVRPDHAPEIKAIRQDFKINWGGRMNVLILGCDERDSMYLGTRSDTIILANIDLKDKAIRLLSIPRDTRVYIPDYEAWDKMNSTINPNYFPSGGIPLTLRTVEHLLKVPIRLYLKLDFDAFEKVVDALGGIMLDVEKDMYYYDPTDGTLINLKEGYQRLDGDQSLQYVRFRWDYQGDFARDTDGKIYGRVARQMNFMKALTKQVLEVRNVLKINNIISSLAKTVETNMDTSEMLKLALTFRDMDVNEQLTVLSFPGEIDMIQGISFIVTMEDELEEIIKTELSGGNLYETPDEEQER